MGKRGIWMIRLDIPSRGVIELHHAVFDINGTLAIDGRAIPGIADRLKKLAEQLSLHALTAGTHGNMTELERSLGISIQLIGTGEEKAQYVEQLGPAHVIAFGNGMNDAGMLRLAAIGVAVLAEEGTALGALDLVLHPIRLVATLRG
jgi:soluble P-type ATPase